jgi:hypothetical protein
MQDVISIYPLFLENETTVKKCSTLHKAPRWVAMITPKRMVLTTPKKQPTRAIRRWSSLPRYREHCMWVYACLRKQRCHAWLLTTCFP